MSDRLVRHLGENGVLTLRLNRPHKRNAIDTPMIDALLTELETADLDSTVNVVVVRGAGKDFCSGADLVELLASADRTPEENAADAARLGDVFIQAGGVELFNRTKDSDVQARPLAGG